jgi:hypothetical protein
MTSFRLMGSKGVNAGYAVHGTYRNAVRKVRRKNADMLPLPTC